MRLWVTLKDAGTESFESCDTADAWAMLPFAAQETAIVLTAALEMARRRDTVGRLFRWGFDMRDTPWDSVQGCNSAALDSISGHHSLTAS